LHESSNDIIREEIDSLLASGVDLDQVVILESEQLAGLIKENSECVELLERLIRYALANARKIQEARELVLKIQ